ncbi:xaa-pro dipeptidase app [Pseudovirgaria hyperparasitica]|uniref:Xaa-Pro aminopeptidase n=1 Tax=Pseudovirgaria hyperparasitica TaxID=470096 RepID=A0A6A6WC16_9PEZI|nr:xaa-pro dipeptidase app [Pseudovirgaria hyperparasitica]KAF2760382.1 xaa-pro dipeptidase app [Pseudovirgaria hyperparasitica]
MRRAALCALGRGFIQPVSRSITRRPNLLPKAVLATNQQRTLTQVSAADLQFGQPLHETHPHLLKPGELTPGITALEYAERRANLARQLPTGSCAVLAASELKFRSGAVFYEFGQDTDFYYLTGFMEPEALAIIEKTGEGDEHTFHLYVRPKDEHAEKWEGFRSGVQAAEDVFNADEAGDITRISKFLPNILRRSTTVYTDLPAPFNPSSPFGKYISGHTKSSSSGLPSLLSELSRSTLKPLRPLLNNLRIIKSPSEIACMRHAGQASGRAFTAAMRQAFKGEKDLWAFLAYKFKTNGCDGEAYVPVVAGGANALSIHYVRNDALLDPKHLVLVDAGGSYGGYITDITRTWPVGGRFSDPQRELYEVVLGVQRTCVSLCRADARLSLDQIHRIAENGLKDALKGLGFEMGSGDGVLNELFPHHLGHYLGLDIHDCPGYTRGKALVEGQVVTVEPGIYVPDDERYPKAFRGIGIRIEDSVAVGEENPVLLTTEAVKEVVDIEALRD